MKKLTSLTVLAIASCCVCMAQQRTGTPDSATDPRLIEAGDPSFVRFSAVIQDPNKVWLQWDVDSAVEGDRKSVV